MKKLLAILLGCLLIMSSCKSFTQVNNRKNVTIDPVFPSPYEYKFNSNVELPDSLGGNQYKGWAAIDGKINDNNLKLENLRILKLLLINEKNDTIINYYFGIDSKSFENIYPPNVIRYLPFFEDYAKTVVVNKVEGISTENMNNATLILRFKKE
jgi:hypothetical protein